MVASPTGRQQFGAFPGCTEEWRRAFAEQPFHRWLGLSLEDARPGMARVRLDIGPETPRGAGDGVHGGILATLVDIAMLQALMATFAPGVRARGTADLNITYLRPATGAAIFAEATVLREGRSLSVVEVSITDSEGRLCARGRTLYATSRDRS